MKEKNCCDSVKNKNEKAQKSQKAQKNRKSERITDSDKQSEEKRY